jgi:hypothetical protein
MGESMKLRIYAHYFSTGLFVKSPECLSQIIDEQIMKRSEIYQRLIPAQTDEIKGPTFLQAKDNNVKPEAKFLRNMIPGAKANLSIWTK